MTDDKPLAHDELGDDLDKMLRREMYFVGMEEIIDAHGWACQGVFTDTHAWVYTIGNNANELPELIMTTASMEMAHSMLNDLTHRMREHGLKIIAGQTLMVEDMEFRVVAVPLDQIIDSDLFNGWYGYYHIKPEDRRRKPVWVMQVVWPGYNAADVSEADREAGVIIAEEPDPNLLVWPTKDDPWADQPIYGEVWW